MKDMEKKINHADNFRVVVSSSEIQEKHYKESREKWDHYTKTLELAPVPLHVDIELTNICDLKCAFCETNKMKRKKGRMPFERFCRIVDQAAALGVDSAKLNLWGESVLHPEIIKMIDYAKKNSSLILQFNTNANRMSSEIAKGFVETGLDRLTISIDGMDQEVYSKLRIGGDYDTVVKNVRKLIEWKKELKSSYPEVTVQMIRTKNNIHQVEDFIKYWEGLADRISVTNIGITADESILQYSMREEQKHQERKSCEQPWQRLSILWDGTVTVCCNDFDGFLKIGNIDDDKLADLWVCEKLQELRARHKKCDFNGLICSTCSNTYIYS